MTDSLNLFHYDPIVGDDTIRIIEIRPGSDIDLVYCRLRTVRLSEKPRYEALSYCWGDPTFNQQIQCNEQRLPITTNLYAALKQLRYNTEPRILWADAICINQHDTDERNQQVRLMRQVYQIAERVVVWLGAEAQFTYLGITLITKLAAANKQMYLFKDQGIPAQREVAALLRENNLPQLSADEWKGIIELHQRSWFERGWIVQEAAVASSTIICCGRFAVTLEEFISAIIYSVTTGLAEHFLTPNSTRIISIALTSQLFKQGRQSSLLSLLLRHRRAITTDPRDKVFALCGIAYDAGPGSLDIQINYHPSHSVQGVYREFAVKMLAKYKNLDVLSVPNENRILELPSWVPDFSTSVWTSSLTREEHGYQSSSPFRASLNSRCSAEVSEDGRLLILAGHQIDSIAKVSETQLAEMGNEGAFAPFQTIKRTFEERRRYINWRHLAGLSSTSRYVTGEDLEDAYRQTLLAGYNPGKNMLSSYNPGKNMLSDSDVIKAHYNGWNRHAFKHAYLRHLPSPLFEFALAVTVFVSILALIGRCLICLPINLAPFGFKAMLGNVANRKMVKTKKGFIGLAGAEIKAGDTIIICKGGKMPLVVRREESGNFKLICDCYIHGIMAGEAFEERRCEKIALC